MPETVSLTIDGLQVRVPAGTPVATAILSSGRTSFRRSVRGEPRGPLCGMGICYECRVTVNGQAHLRSCQIPCQDGMDVQTDG
ncbi:MAG: (2Fe-2S)-binding protein [Acidobacteriia bacterium]|nr:(2Fe-2S)-binding protein [Terriglobia bacterium]